MFCCSTVIIPVSQSEGYAPQADSLAVVALCQSEKYVKILYCSKVKFNFGLISNFGIH